VRSISSSGCDKFPEELVAKLTSLEKVNCEAFSAYYNWEPDDPDEREQNAIDYTTVTTDVLPSLLEMVDHHFDSEAHNFNFKALLTASPKIATVGQFTVDSNVGDEDYDGPAELLSELRSVTQPIEVLFEV